jgi:Gpi18-like mannosyltransferase
MQLPANYSEGRESPPSETLPDGERMLTEDEPSREREDQTDSGIISKRSTWLSALKSILPIYIATHVAFLILTYLATLFAFIPKNFSLYSLSLSTLVESWDRWDSNHFVEIATKGYDVAYRTAFFPLYPMLESGLAYLIHSPFVAGLIISNLAGLGMLAVLYRLVEEDFDSKRAYCTVLYFAVFPTAFFFAAAYNESLFLLFTLLSFYHIRRGHWWWAGLFGFLASLTRSAGLFLLLPFLYEYLCQHSFKLKRIRFDIISGAAIPMGLGIFALYCYIRFHDPLAFSHAQQSGWLRDMHGPWHGLLDSFLMIIYRGILSFDSIHNVIDLSAGLLMLVLMILCFVGPWKFPRELWAYGFYAASMYLFFLLFPVAGGFPLAALSRYVLELFPVFIVLATMGKGQQFNLYYLTFSGSILVFMLLQFLTGYWII